MKYYDLIIVGGGAAGFFTAINTAIKNPNLSIAIIEKNREVLQKVRVSGGGRCNVTNAITNPKELSNNYPRGFDVLEDPFKIFGSAETFQWFQNEGVALKIEADGRVFPKSNSSSAIIDLFKYLIKKNNIELFTSLKIINLTKKGNIFNVETKDFSIFQSKFLMLASGSDKHVLTLVSNMYIECLPQVPSLFTFNIGDEDLKELSGLSFKNSKIVVKNTPIAQSGPLLITHWGLSGPCILKLSAWGALLLNELDYKFEISINFFPDWNGQSLIEAFKKQAIDNPKKSVLTTPIDGIPIRFWKYLCKKIQILETQKWAETGKKHWHAFENQMLNAVYKVDGKSTFKEEFVTAGGINISEVNLGSFESTKISNLFFAGEIINIDAVTGGFNFQAAWTGAWLAANKISGLTAKVKC